MYNAKIITDAGKFFDFSFSNGVLFDISPLSGAEVDISTSQGFGQIGNTVEAQSVGGIYRTIRGRLLSRDAARHMLHVLGIFTAGKLYVNNTHYCPVVIASTPQISQNKYGNIPFMLRVFCPSPYWYSADGKNVMINDYTPAFSFPVCYDTHVFGIIGGNAFVNVYNEGDAEADMEITFSCEGEASGYGIANVMTGAVLRFTDTIRAGEKVTLKRAGGRITAVKKSVGREDRSMLAAITDDSSLFSLAAGDNVLRVTADTGEEVLRVSISYNAAYMGVLV